MAKGKYEEWLQQEKLILIESWARDGLTEEQIAKNMDVSYSTLREWKKKYSALSAVLKKGKKMADVVMENALYERGLGGIRKVNKTFKLKHTYYDAQGRKCEKEELATGEDEIYIPGDTTAQIFWLKNRKPEQWRDKRIVEDGKEDKALKLIENMCTVADLFQNPISNRSIEALEETADE